MASIAEKLAQTRADITAAERQLSDLQVKIIDMRVAAAAFQAEYEQRVWPYQEALQRVQDEVADLHGSTEKIKIPGVPEDYVTADEQYRRVWRPSAGDKAAKDVVFKPRAEMESSADAATLKRIYRQLALKFHPDLAPDAATRERWTELMRKINAAYAAGDASALQGLADALRNEAPPDAGLTTETALALVPDEDELVQAESRLQSVQLAIQSVEAEIFEVEWGWEIKLKKEVDAARDKGRDLLAEIAADLKARTQQAQRELDRLKGR